MEIYEADFGCEERPDGQETMVMVRLKSEKSGEEHTLQMRDADLEAEKILEGDLVSLEESGRLIKKKNEMEKQLEEEQ
ncbi:hypothetical protein [Brotaphodocola sp.]|uniref:hypothetical protein n=1 Tax=Brotaphodocola sp. TaxID=3073577 RepID=UPI003D7C88E7